MLPRSMEQNGVPSHLGGRPILPAPPRADTRTTSGPGSLHSTALPDRKSMTKSACSACRRRKSKCNGERPKCKICLSKGSACEYDTDTKGETSSQALKRKYDDLTSRKSASEQIYEILQARPDIEAAEIFKRIRGGMDAETILRYVQEGDVLLQLALKPETRYRYEFPYVKELPAFLQRVENPYLSALVYEWGSRDSWGQQRSTIGTVVEYEDAYLKPYHAAELVDPLLEVVKPSEWTTVSANDRLMQKLLGVYFMYGYQWFIFFNKDYFLQDMAAKRHRFCSPLLVNAILACAYSCDMRIANRYEYWNPQSLGYQFYAEAKRLWQMEVGRSQLTTIHAAGVITQLHAMTCMDKPGWSYILQAITLAHDLRLYDPEATAKIKSRKERNARDFTAWALFGYQCLHCYVMFDEPVLLEAPKIPLPDPSTNPEWYGQIWVKYPMSSQTISVHFGHLFKACAGVRTIMNEICIRIFAKPAPVPKVTFEEVAEFHNRLTHWYQNLAAPLTPSRIVTPGHMMLHMNYNTVLMNLYEAFTAQEASASQPHGGSIADVAKIHLETLIRLYYLRHGFVAFDPFLIHPLNVLGFSTINKIREHPDTSDLQALRSTLVLAAKGAYDQGQSHYIGHVTLRFMREAMRPAEKQLLSQIADVKIEEDDGTKSQMAEVQARWAPSILSVGDDPEAQRLSNLVNKFMELNAEEHSDGSSDASPAPSS